jgi:hypothetical protein
MPKAKKTHSVLFCMKTSTEMNLDQLFHEFNSCIDFDEMKDKGIVITSMSAPDKPTRAGSPRPSPSNGIDTEGLKKNLSKITSLMKAKKWWHYYVGICGLILILTLLSKWAIRFLAWLF